MIKFDMPSVDRLLPVVTFSLGLLVACTMPAGLLGQAAQAQNSSNQQEAMHYSLYYESFKNDEFRSAKSDLEWIIDNAPGFPNGDDRNFRRQYELYVGLAEQAGSEEKRQAYLDTAATLLATAPERMKKAGVEFETYEWEIRRGRFLQEHQDALPKLETDVLTDAQTHYRKAFDLAPQQVDPYYIQQVLRTYVENNEQEKALEFIETVEAKCSKDEELKQILSSVRGDIFGKNPQAKIEHLESKLKKVSSSDSSEVMLSLFNAYVDVGNIEKASDLAPKLMKTNPPAETVTEIAQMRLEDGRPKEALRAYDMAVKQGAELKAEDYFNRGSAYQQAGQFSKARRAFSKAIEKKSDFGRAYIGIGDLYAKAVSKCSGSKLGRKDKAVYWLAVDKYRQAIAVDSTLKSVAEGKIRSYRKVFPTKEDIFYRDDWTEGESFTVDYGCYSWIGETTTVRPAP